MRPRLGQVADRPHQGCRRGRQPHQGGAGPALQGAAADAEGHPAGRAAAGGRLAVLRQHPDAAVAAAGRAPPAGGALRVRVRRQQLPRGAGGVPPRKARRGLGRLGRTVRGVRGNATGRRGGVGEGPGRVEGVRPRRRAVPGRLPPGRPVPARPRRPPRPDRPCEARRRSEGQARRRPVRRRLVHPGRRLLRQRPGAGEAGGALPRAGVAGGRHAPRPGLPVPGGAREPRRRRRGGRRPAGRRVRRRPALRPDLPAHRVGRGREAASGRRPAGHRRRPAGPRGGQLRGLAGPGGAVRAGGGRLRRAQLRGTAGARRRRAAQPGRPVRPVLPARQGHGPAAGRRPGGDARRLRPAP